MLFIYTHTPPPHIFFMRPSLDGQVGCFAYILGIIIMMPFQITGHVLGYIPGSRTAGSHGSSVFSFLETSILLSIAVAPINSSPKVYKGTLFSISSPIFLTCDLFNNIQSDVSVDSLCGIDDHFSDD